MKETKSMQTTAAGNVVKESKVCGLCGKRVGYNAAGYLARHGATRGGADCYTRGLAAWVRIEDGIMALAAWAKARG